MKKNNKSIHFYKRNDKTSIDYVGKCLYEQISNKYDAELFDLTKVNNSIFKNKEIGIVYGLPTDLHWLRNYKIKIGGLVCEKMLSSREIEKIYEAKLDEIWVPSEFCKNIFNQAGFYKVKVIPHGIKDIKSRKKHKQNDSILMVYKSHPPFSFSTIRKGFIEAIEAFNKLKDKKLILRTQYQQYYNNYNLSNIEFMENRVEDIYELYKQYDAILCPSHSEGFGLIGLEALACGIPLISTKTGNDYLTDDIKYFNLNLPVTSENIICSINELYSNFDKYTKIAHKQASKIQKKYNWKQVGKIVCDELKKFL